MEIALLHKHLFFGVEPRCKQLQIKQGDNLTWINDSQSQKFMTAGTKLQL